MKTSLKQRPFKTIKTEVMEQLELSPTIKPFAIGTDHLAEKCFDLIQLLKRFNIDHYGLNRISVDEIEIVIDNNIYSQISLQYIDGSIWLLGLSDCIDGLIPLAEHDNLADGLNSLGIFDDNFCDWDCEY
jgi:hypothetical protein